ILSEALEARSRRIASRQSRDTILRQAQDDRALHAFRRANPNQIQYFGKYRFRRERQRETCEPRLAIVDENPALGVKLMEIRSDVARVFRQAMRREVIDDAADDVR